MNMRDEAVEAAYQTWRAEYQGACTFCDLIGGNGAPEDEIVLEHDFFITMRNRFPYKEWDNLDVSEHLMLVPKRHIRSMLDMTDEEAVEYVRLIAGYEHDSYSIYTRAHTNLSRTIPHVHTHLFAGASFRPAMLQ